MWRLGTTAAILTIVTLFTGAALYHSTEFSSGPGLDELAEVPLMAAMFVAMVFYTERTKSATAAQRRMLERQRDFVRDASHEFRTPLTIARNHAELLRASADAREAIGDADVIIDEINRLSSISDRLLTIAAAEHPDFLDLRPIRIERVVSTVVERWRATIPRHWVLDAQAGGWVDGDQDRLELAFDSLIENAVKFTSEDDSIAVRTETDGRSAIVVVANTGSAIPGDQIDRIFDRFARADTSRARGRGGTGLGLSIVKAVVEGHGGTVEVRSPAGVGPVFTVRLPLRAPNGSDGSPLTLDGIGGTSPVLADLSEG
jgi:two-component system OmpR family sensor kinase